MPREPLPRLPNSPWQLRQAEAAAGRSASNAGGTAAASSAKPPEVKPVSAANRSTHGRAAAGGSTASPILVEAGANVCGAVDQPSVPAESRDQRSASSWLVRAHREPRPAPAPIVPGALPPRPSWTVRRDQRAASGPAAPRLRHVEAASSREDRPHDSAASTSCGAELAEVSDDDPSLHSAAPPEATAPSSRPASAAIQPAVAATPASSGPFDRHEPHAQIASPSAAGDESLVQNASGPVCRNQEVSLATDVPPGIAGHDGASSNVVAHEAPLPVPSGAVRTDEDSVDGATPTATVDAPSATDAARDASLLPSSQFTSDAATTAVPSEMPSRAVQQDDQGISEVASLRVDQRVTRSAGSEEDAAIVELPDVGRLSRRRLRHLEASLSGATEGSDSERSSSPSSSTVPTAQHRTNSADGTNPVDSARREVQGQPAARSTHAAELRLTSAQRRASSSRVDSAAVEELRRRTHFVDVPGIGSVSRRQLQQLEAVVAGDANSPVGDDLPDLSQMTDDQLVSLESSMNARRGSADELARATALHQAATSLSLRTSHMLHLVLRMAAGLMLEDEAPDVQGEAWKINEDAWDRLVAVSKSPDGQECAICCESLTEASSSGSLVALPCSEHSCQSFFHSDCIRGWLQRKPNCPLCRAECKELVVPDCTHAGLPTLLIESDQLAETVARIGAEAESTPAFRPFRPGPIAEVEAGETPGFRAAEAPVQWERGDLMEGETAVVASAADLLRFVNAGGRQALSRQARSAGVAARRARAEEEDGESRAGEAPSQQVRRSSRSARAEEVGESRASEGRPAAALAAALAGRAAALGVPDLGDAIGRSLSSSRATGGHSRVPRERSRASLLMNPARHARPSLIGRQSSLPSLRQS
eukprot:gnl/TRDRNA2_/TRDRNA2_35469_c0_seq1.p1 gnl/TRDRNA2_/TRDRNA2_35469_c0~~gnl/TRDRNA2_/TRDRNA2_35469_c0_seq1.p1  ORF type:complete len:879 (+),score=128.03 gnl/TRDRNA2_/TRDRNA2_35469_c0_seq1:76-2712(+)